MNIPLFRYLKNSRKYLISYLHPSSFISEQFRVIRAVLLRYVREKGVRSILVTSTLPQEGKTFVSSNLAVSIAQEVQNHVLLVDSDLRNPTLHTTFGMKNTKKGLAMVFENRVSLPEVIYKTDIPNLSIIPAGYSAVKNTRVISRERMKSLLDEIKSLFPDCFIILDSGPIQLLADSLVMSEIVDGVVLVVKVGETQRNLVNKSAEIIGRERILGVVLNYCQMSGNVYHRYYKYYRKTVQNMNVESSNGRESA